ncbi:MAG: hypothetical protein Q8M66_02250 [Actinomycetota bacterium]|nr:hypothetical protein [Actinomycetota bacterium]
MSSLAQALPSFEGEKLSFSLSRGEESDLLWEVSGEYYFSNQHQSPLSQAIAFPIPTSQDTDSALITNLSIIEPTDSMAVKLLTQTDSGIVFLLDLPARSFAGLRLAYSQKVWGKQAVYILSTANNWGRPLPYCQIELFVQRGIELIEPPFPDAQIIQGEEGSVYLWQFVDFVPEGEFVLMLR